VCGYAQMGVQCVDIRYVGVMCVGVMCAVFMGVR